MDPLFREIEGLLHSLSDDQRIFRLIELVTSIHSPIISDYVAREVVTAAKLAHPRQSLSLLKFVFLYSKKDVKFFNSVKPLIPTVVMHCYQVASDKETVRLYIQSWRMNNQWADLAASCSGLIRVFDNRAELASVAHDLQATSLSGIVDKCRHHPSDRTTLLQAQGACEARLEAVISAINSVSSIVISP